MRVLRRVIDGASRLVGTLKRNQLISIAKSKPPIKVNIGCGLSVAPGWINIDGSLNALVATLPSFFHKLAYRFTGASRYYSKEDYCRLLGDHRFIHHDLVHGIPLADETADFVYSSHFLEHLSRFDGVSLIGEMFRVLKRSGITRLSVPDLKYAISLYEKGEKEKMLTAYFFVEDDESFYARHKYLYDYEMLREIMCQEGFRNVSRCDFRKGRTPDLSVLDNRPEESLFIEAEKP